jgi:adenylyltransferase/sulfurtransferase
MYDSLQCSFLRIKKPPRQRNCPVCGTDAIITSMKESYTASESARGPACSVLHKPSELESSRVVSCSDYQRLRQRQEPHILLDVRVKEQYDLCSLPGAINIPLASIRHRLDEISSLSDGTKTVYCICRRGIASAEATKLIDESLGSFPSIHSVKNIKGGLDAWRLDVDGSFPKY